jgi:4-coumarate--CoA ligase (photoactive yellow protein activation family)
VSLHAWWQGPEFPRYIADLLLDAIQYLRPGLTFSGGKASLGLLTDASRLDLDSLDRFSLAVTLAEALQFPRIERPERLQEINNLPDWVAEARRCLSTSSSAIGFRTSGSTGRPKFVVHEFDALAQEIDSLASIFSGRTRILSAVPAHHIYGFLFTVLLPAHLHAEVIDVRAHSPRGVRAIAKPGDLIVAFPSYWRSRTEGAWPEDIAGVSSGAPLSTDAATSIMAGKLNRLVEIYGSTETGGIGWREWRESAAAPFRLFRHLVREDERSVRKSVNGVTRHYPLPDHVTWHGPDLLAPVSRRDGAVQVGGVNVYPESIRAVLLAHPHVADAEVRLMTPDEGERIKAFIVAKDPRVPPPELRLALEAWVNERLQPLERPRAYTFGTAVPVNAMGKKIDWQIG